MPREKHPTLPTGYKTFRLRRSWSDIRGELRVSSGTDDPKIFAGINTMLDELANTGRWSEINAIKNGTISPLLAYHKWKKGTLDGSVSLKLAGDVITSLNVWLNNKQSRPSTKKGYGSKINQLKKIVKRGESVANLPEIVKRAKTSAEKTKHFNSFNQTKMMLLAFLRDTYGKHTEIYRDVNAVPKFSLKTTEVLERNKKFVKRPLSVREVAALCKAIGRDDVSAMIWSLATTGARGEGEYWGIDGMLPNKPHITVENNKIHIKGSKTLNSDREIPLIMRPSNPTMTRAALSHVLDDFRGDDKQISIYSFRKSYATWLEEAGIPLSRRNAYRGHSKISMADTYEAAQTKRFLVQDALTLQSFIKSELTRTDDDTPSAVKPMNLSEVMVG